MRVSRLQLKAAQEFGFGGFGLAQIVQHFAAGAVQAEIRRPQAHRVVKQCKGGSGIVRKPEALCQVCCLAQNRLVIPVRGFDQLDDKLTLVELQQLCRHERQRPPPPRQQRGFRGT